jgi:hypothetical protein
MADDKKGGNVPPLTLNYWIRIAFINYQIVTLSRNEKGHLFEDALKENTNENMLFSI